MPLMTTKPMFDLAYDGGFAVGAFNVNNMELARGLRDQTVECRPSVVEGRAAVIEGRAAVIAVGGYLDAFGGDDA
jgi:fructose/tagatose bisphosphate aldolase